MAQGGTFSGVFIDENILGVAYELDALRPGLVYWVGHPAIPEIPVSAKDPRPARRARRKWPSPDLYHAGQEDPPRQE